MGLKEWKEEGRISRPVFEKLSLLVDLIQEWNARINLTGFRKRKELEEILIGEALLAVSALDVTGKGIVDFGSGAGVPGLIWAVCVPTASVTSVEIRQKKVAFQKHAARMLGLEVEIIAGQFPSVIWSRKFDVIVSRAIRFDLRLWQEAEKLLAPEGKLIRFSRYGAEEPGWDSIPLSSRASLLIRTPPCK